MSNESRHILITPGEPAGVGPDITVKIAQEQWDAALTVVADPQLLLERAEQLRLPLEIITCDINAPLRKHQAGKLHVLPVKLDASVIPGKLNPANAPYVLRTLSLAATLSEQHKSHAIVTGPVHKSVINQAGIPFSGHTEFFAEKCGATQTVMLFVVDQLKVALATTHVPLADVSKTLTQPRLEKVLQVLQHDLKKYFHIPAPRILVCGLNPHAGEGGYLGREEIDVIAPVIRKLRDQGYNLSDPLPADTLFTPQQLKKADAILAMYHDQALPVVKHIGFDRAVNMTLGLPFIRTSVDHGTALDIAGSGKADAGSMRAALALAVKTAGGASPA